MVNSHTIRKTFIGNLYKLVLTPNLIASMSGHTGSKSLYLDIYHHGKRTYEPLKLYLISEAYTNERMLLNNVDKDILFS